MPRNNKNKKKGNKKKAKNHHHHQQQQQEPVVPNHRAVELDAAIAAVRAEAAHNMDSATATEAEARDHETVAAATINTTSTTTNSPTSIAAGMNDWGFEAKECPLCLDTIMDSQRNSSYFACCGQRICTKCFVKTQFHPSNQMRDTCPYCRADTSDTSGETEMQRMWERANRGDANAMYNIGGRYDKGIGGLPLDQELARVWYERAALKGESRAAYNLGCSWRDGEGGPINKKQAAKFFRMAAEQGHIQASTELGILLMGEGGGGSKDEEEGKMWLRKSAQAGDTVAIQRLDLIEMRDRFRSSCHNLMRHQQEGSSSSATASAAPFSFESFLEAVSHLDLE